jgi:hypothetical protein
MPALATDIMKKPSAPKVLTCLFTHRSTTGLVARRLQPTIYKLTYKFLLQLIVVHWHLSSAWWTLGNKVEDNILDFSTSEGQFFQLNLVFNFTGHKIKIK